MDITLSGYEKERLDAENNFDIVYINRYQKYLGEELMRAKGKDLTMAQFAEECDISAATLSRIVNGTIQKPLEKEKIRKIAEHSHDPYVTYRSLMNANGMVPEDDDTPTRKVSAKNREAGRKHKSRIEAIVKDAFFDVCYMTGKVSYEEAVEKDPLYGKARYISSTCGSFQFKAVVSENSAPFYLHFSINAIPDIEYEYGSMEKFLKKVPREARFILSSSSDVFLRDTWEPEIFEKCPFSIVVDRAPMFDELVKLFNGITVNGFFSILLVNVEESRVEKEYLFPRRKIDGKIFPHLFNETQSTVNEEI